MIIKIKKERVIAPGIFRSFFSHSIKTILIIDHVSSRKLPSDIYQLKTKMYASWHAGLTARSTLSGGGGGEGQGREDNCLFDKQGGVAC